MEDDKKVYYELRDYQEDTVQNIRKIFNQEEHNRFAAVVLPTGGGKSFVAMQELLEMTMDENQEVSQRAIEEILELDRRGLLNNTPILYLAPSHEILSQVKLHIVKNIIFNIPGLENMSISEIDSMLNEDFPFLNLEGINENTSEILRDDASAREKRNAILRKISPEQINQLVKRAFPNFDLKCYAGVKENGEPVPNEDIFTEKDAQKKYALIILDEAHRVGATTWNKNVKDVIDRNPQAKVLAITATPQRTDQIGKEMMQDIARMVYPNETVLQDEYTAKTIYVLDGMRDGIVTSPDVVDYAPALGMTKEYSEIRQRYKKARGSDKEKIGKILIAMEAIMGYKPKDKDLVEVDENPEDLETEDSKEVVLSENEEKKEDKRIGNCINQNLRNRHGKYIAFIPSNRKSDESENKGQREYFEKWEERLKGQFKGVLDENGKQVQLNIRFVTSDTKVQTAQENSEVLKAFEDASSETGPIEILIAIDKLNEGVHVDGIDGEFMYRSIGENSSTLYLQQTGRCISSMDPKINSPEAFKNRPKTQIFDFRANTFKQVNNNTGAKTSEQYDLGKIEEITTWIQKEGRNPDANSDNLMEARLAIALRRLVEKYKAYSNNEVPTTLPNREKIENIAEIITENNLWEVEIPERTAYPNEVELTGASFLAYTDSQKKFMELYYEAKSLSKDREIPADQRVKKLINVLRILKTHNPDIELPVGLMIKNNSNKYVKSKGLESISLDGFLEKNFDKSEIDRILTDLEDTDRVNAKSRKEVYHRGEVFDFGEELAFARGLLWTSQAKYMETGVESIFESYNLSELIKIGLIDTEKLKELTTEAQSLGYNVKNVFNEKGNIISDLYPADKMPDFGVIESIAGRDYRTGEKYRFGYDAEGYDKDGYDLFGYDRHGFNRDKTIHRDTGIASDPRGFKWDAESSKWVNLLTKEPQDLLGYNIDGYHDTYNDEEIVTGGFERPQGPKMVGGTPNYYIPRWHRKREDGRYEFNGRLTNPATKWDCHDFRYESNAKWGYFQNVGKRNTNYGGFWSNGATEQKPTELSYFYSNDGKDIDEYNENGFKEVLVNGKKMNIHRDTSWNYNRQGKVERWVNVATTKKRIPKKRIKIS